MIHSRRGTTIMETMVAMCLLGAAFVVTAQMLAVCARQRQAAERQFVAQLAASNMAERIAVMPFADVSEGTLAALALPAEARAALGDARLKIDCATSADDGPPSKRIGIEVSWPTSGSTHRSVRLVTWTYDQAEAPR